MKILSMVCLWVALLSPALSSAQVNLRGKVTDATTAEALQGVNIVLMEIQRGTASDEKGDFVVNNVPSGTYTLRASYVGYKQFEETITVGSVDFNINIQLEPDFQALDEMVVTALGLSRDKKSVGYAVQEIGGDALTMVQQDNIVGSLAGKVAGVQVLSNSGANLGGSQKIRIRGAMGLSDGQPLFIVDGTPISNSNFGVDDGSSGRDYGNLANDINMDDVESISVLKGAAASALYGSRASYGVVLITTKKGKAASAAKKGIGISYSNTVTFDEVFILPEYQNEYGGGYSQSFINVVDPVDNQTYKRINYAADESWGPKMDGTPYRPWWSWFPGDFDGDGTDDYGKTVPFSPNPDNVNNFFDTGLSVTNSIAVDNATEKSSYRLSFSNQTSKGVIPNSTLDKTNVSFNGSLRISDHWESNLSLNYARTDGFGRPVNGYTSGNSVNSFNQWFQRQLDMDELRNYKSPDGTMRSWNLSSITNVGPLYWDSPFFTPYESPSKDGRNRVFGNAGLTYIHNDKFRISATLRSDFYDFTIEDRVGSGGLEIDFYSKQSISSVENNYELLANYKDDYGDFDLSVLAGGNILKTENNSNYAATSGGLSVAGFYNISASLERPTTATSLSERQVNSMFAQANLGFKDMAYLDLTVRNDISSTLPKENNSYWYYSASSSFIFTQLEPLKNLGFLNFGKIRASIAQVGSDTGPYQTAFTYALGESFGSNATMFVPNQLPNIDLKPAISTDYEVGMELRFLDARLVLDVNYYNRVKKDEILPLTVSGATGVSTSLVNAGEFKSSGMEYQLSGTPFQTRDFSINMALNFATATSEVIALAEGLNRRALFNSSTIGVWATVGEQWGNVVGRGYQEHANGKRLIEDGYYVRQGTKDLGHILPDYTGGFRLDVSWKNFQLGSFLEFQKGGQYYSTTMRYGQYSGLLKNTVGNNVLGNPKRDPVLDSNGNEVLYVAVDQAGTGSGGELVEGVDASGAPVRFLYNTQDYYAGLEYFREEFLYDASYIKLREVRLGYTIPSSWISKTPIARANIAFTVRNALLLYSTVKGIDPTSATTSGTGVNFFEGAGLPGVRTFGFNVNLNF